MPASHSRSSTNESGALVSGHRQRGPRTAARTAALDSSLAQLLPVYARARAAGTPLVLGMVVATRGSTYRKAGAQVLVTDDGHCEGLISGGCLEGDLVERARPVFATGQPRIVHYDHSSEDDLPWGLGIGCGGAIEIWLARVDAGNRWEPMATLARCAAQGSTCSIGVVLESTVADLPAGSIFASDEPSGLAADAPAAVRDGLLAQQSGDGRPATCTFETDGGTLRMFYASLVPPRSLLVVGAGPDARPLVELALKMGWQVTIADHRPAYADPANFPSQVQVVNTRPEQLAGQVELARLDAAVVMNHHVATDLACLAALAATPIPYIGLLGPAARRDRLLADLGAVAGELGTRLRAPVGLKLGGRDPSSVALSIVAELQACFHGQDGRGH
jgi:xanthine dehydrogenase accessory factor